MNYASDLSQAPALQYVEVQERLHLTTQQAPLLIHYARSSEPVTPHTDDFRRKIVHCDNSSSNPSHQTKTRIEMKARKSFLPDTPARIGTCVDTDKAIFGMIVQGKLPNYVCLWDRTYLRIEMDDWTACSLLYNNQPLMPEAPLREVTCTALNREVLAVLSDVPLIIDYVYLKLDEEEEEKLEAMIAQHDILMRFFDSLMKIRLEQNVPEEEMRDFLSTDAYYLSLEDSMECRHW